MPSFVSSRSALSSLSPLPSFSQRGNGFGWVGAVAYILLMSVVLVVSSDEGAFPSAASSLFRGVNAQPASPSSNVEITFGYIRMSVYDSPDVLAGLLATIKDANDKVITPNIHYNLHVSTIPCPNVSFCEPHAIASNAEFTAIIDDFKVKMRNFSAVLSPNHILSPQILDEAKRLGGVPVINPQTMRAEDFAVGADNVLNFQQSFFAEILHMFTFMHQDDGCAYSGIIYEQFSEIASHLDATKKLFTDGGLAEPALLDVTTAQPMQYSRFFVEEPRRRCFLILLTHSHFIDLANFVVRAFQLKNDGTFRSRFYGTSLMAGDRFALFDGTSWPFETTFYTSWQPSYNATAATEGLSSLVVNSVNAGADSLTDLRTSNAIYTAFNNWRYNTSVAPNFVDDSVDLSSIPFAGSSSEAAYFLTHVDASDAIPTVPRDMMLGAYIVARYAVDLIGAAVGRHNKNFMEGVMMGRQPVMEWSFVVDAAYASPSALGDYPFGRMQRRCPVRPFDQICFCNVPTLTAFVHRANSTTGYMYPVFDDVSRGHREVASRAFDVACKNDQATSRIYPLTLLMLNIDPRHQGALEGFPLAIRVLSQAAINAVLSVAMRGINNAPIAPARPFNYAPFTISPTSNTASTLSFESASYNSFIIFGSVEGPIKTANRLVLFPSILTIALEDVPLTSFADGWQYNIVNLQPVLADGIHALVAYYKDSVDNAGVTFTAVYYIVTIPAEAELLSKSLATFGFNVPVEQIVVSTDVAVWESAVQSWLAASEKPFIYAASVGLVDLLGRAYELVATHPTTSAVLAWCGPDPFIEVDGSPFAPTNKADVVYAGLIHDFWTPHAQREVPAEVKPLTSMPVAWFALFAADIIQQLGQRALYEYDLPAAQILYQQSVVTSYEVSFGPFSNTTCTAKQIADNDRDRSCQCTKGPRTLHINSARSWEEMVPSTARTRDFKYTQTTCGVVYAPYVDPNDRFMLLVSDNSLSTGAIVGIAVGCASFVLLLVAAFVAFMCCGGRGGRDNSRAPKDSQEGFAVVFTDIQMSTALWSRIPSIMSGAVEQHHRVIRRQIRFNNGYEVKTIGDSFMVAFKEVNDAVSFAVDVQQYLFEAEWHSEIDATYMELIAESAAAEEDHPMETYDDHQMMAPMTRSYRDSNHSPTAGDGGVEVNDASAAPTAMKGLGTLHRSFHGSGAHSLDSPRAGALSPNNNSNIIITNGDDDAAGQRYSPAEVSGFMQPVKSNVASAVQLQPIDAQLVVGAQYSARRHAAAAHDRSLWHGLRVRIGVCYGFGDIRKDPVTHGYDYYGTVVNTAARVEGIGHGGQILVTEDVIKALDDNFLLHEKQATSIALGARAIRGLDDLVPIVQIAPQQLQRRQFPMLRLHIEIDDVEDTTRDDETNTSGTSNSNVANLPYEIAHQLCGNKQYAGRVTADEVVNNYNFLTALLAPTNSKFQMATYGKLGDGWGIENSPRMMQHTSSKVRVLVGLVGKVTRALYMKRSAAAANANAVAGAGASSHNNAYLSSSAARGGAAASGTGMMGGASSAVPQSSSKTHHQHHHGAAGGGSPPQMHVAAAASSSSAGGGGSSHHHSAGAHSKRSLIRPPAIITGGILLATGTPSVDGDGPNFVPDTTAVTDAHSSVT